MSSHGCLELPWANDSRTAIIGHFAREHGALMPDRLVTSANPGSPIFTLIHGVRCCLGTQRSRAEALGLRLFETIPRAFEGGLSLCRAASGRNWDLSEGQIVLTVPASFDEVARNLTAEAAEAAGLGKVTLLEEPQAAFTPGLRVQRFLAQSGELRRHHSGLRRWRRHGGLQPHRHQRKGWQSRTRANQRWRAHSPRWR